MDVLRSEVSASNGSCWGCLYLKGKYRDVKIAFNCLLKLGFQVSGREPSVSSKCVCARAHTHACAHMHTSHVHTYIHACTCVCIYTGASLCVCVCLTVCMSMHTCAHMCLCDMCVHMCVCVFACLCAFECVCIVSRGEFFSRILHAHCLFLFTFSLYHLKG